MHACVFLFSIQIITSIIVMIFTHFSLNYILAGEKSCFCNTDSTVDSDNDGAATY